MEPATQDECSSGGQSSVGKMFFQRFYTESIAQASFLVGCVATGEAVVIDPTRDIGAYLDVASQEGLRIVAVTETHIHADYVSGSRELAHVTGATLFLSREGGPDWQYAYSGEDNVVLIGEGDEIRIGKVRLRTLHTPGHTPEHLSFLLIDGAATDQPVGMFSGDFIFAGDVGRPDLLEVAAGYKDTMRQGAERLYDSLERTRKMSDWLTLWPGHGAGSACGKSLGGAPSSTLGYERIVNPALRAHSREDFTASVLEGQPEPPKYFSRMKKVNREGPSFTNNLWNIERTLVPVDAQLVDVRPIEDFLAGTTRGAISIPLGKSFSKYAGSLLDLLKPVMILAADAKSAVEAAKVLILIGIENLAGWHEPGNEFRLPTADAPSDESQLIDVRGKSEREEDSIEGTLHMPLVYLTNKVDQVTDRAFVHCASGMRSVVAASYLQSQGLHATAVISSFEELKQRLSGLRALGRV